LIQILNCNEYYSQFDGLISLSEYQQSNILKINRGMKHGGVFSLFLFNIYIDDLIIEIIQSDCGCYLNNFKTIILGYWEDLILMASSVAHFQIFLNICQNFSDKWNIKFNSYKSIVISASFKIIKMKIFIYLFIIWNWMIVVKSKYLGLIINENNEPLQSKLSSHKILSPKNSKIQKYYLVIKNGLNKHRVYIKIKYE
jgi:hypothetical protein